MGSGPIGEGSGKIEGINIEGTSATTIIVFAFDFIYKWSSWNSATSRVEVSSSYCVEDMSMRVLSRFS